MLARRWNQNGKVIILSETTDEPISLIGEMAGICYNANISNEEKNYARGLDCILSDHGRTLEFPKIYMLLDEWSAKVLREFYTHIIGVTRLQASTRYIEYGDFKYVVPPTIQKNDAAREVYENVISNIKDGIKKLEELGIPREDASGLLPLNYESKVVCVMDLRELIAMSRVRECSRAYWEFRELFANIKESLGIYSDQWNTLVNELNVFHPKCEEYGYCKEKKSCGRMPKKEVNANV